MNIAGAIEYLSAGLSPVTDEHLTEARLAVSDMAEIPYNRLNKYKASTFPAALMPSWRSWFPAGNPASPCSTYWANGNLWGCPFIQGTAL